MKIDLDKYVTMDEFIERIACSRRAGYRIRAKAIRDGKADAFLKILGKTLILKTRIAELEAYYEPFGSARRSERAKGYGHLGGTQKRINRARAARLRGPHED